MILAVDVDYRADGSAIAAGMWLRHWSSDAAERTVIRRIEQVLPYRTGFFFERELPCILDLLSDMATKPETIVIDGCVWLGPDRCAGLGAHLFEALDQAVPVVGVAKTRFKDTPPSTEIFRGGSSRPLFVTAAGMNEDIARAQVGSMHGRYRVPTMLRAVARACRENWRAAPGEKDNYVYSIAL